MGLQNPRAVVLSLQARTIRRHRFRQVFEDLCLDIGAEWAPALDGSTIPQELWWMKGYVDMKSVDSNKPGYWACFASHMAMLREHYDRCPDCDLLVFEDDIVFVNGFRERWTKFLAALPDDWDMLRLGGLALWEPPFKATEEWILTKAVSNTWGYVVRARSVKKLADLLAKLPVRGRWGIDAIFQKFNDDLRIYAPTIPVLLAASQCHDTELAASKIGKDQCESESGLRSQAASLRRDWQMGWIRTYCIGTGKVRDPHYTASRKACDGNSSFTCCPYLDPVRSNPPGKNSCPSD